MSDLLERTTERHHVIERETDNGPAPPPPRPPTDIDGTPTWPRNAMIVIAILAVIMVVSMFGAMIVRDGDGDSATETEMQSQIDDLIAERDALLLEQDDLMTEFDAATARLDAVETELADVDAQLAEATRQVAISEADAATFGAIRSALIGQRDALRAELAAADLEIAAIENELAMEIDATTNLDMRIAELSREVNALVIRAVTAETERDALADLFPVGVDTALEPADVVGTWDLDWTRRYCEGFTTCGNDPGFDTIRIERTPVDTLRLVIDGHMTAGLGRSEGGLVAIGQSVAAIPACDGVPRTANLSVTVYGLGATMHADGTETVDQLGMTAVVSAPATGSCPAGMSAFGAVLTAG